MTLYSRPGSTSRSSTGHSTALSRTEVYSLQDAQQVIDTITGRRFVCKILMSNNQLGDDGCVELFNLFSSAQGRQHPVSAIHLGSNNIGNAGLLAITNYLKDNVHLHSLQLPNNQFTGDALTIAAFVHAINTSRLQTLNLASNENFLGDAFIEAFLSALHCTTLRHLNVTATRLTGRSAPAIVAYLSSKQSCHLRYFSCNANYLGSPGVKSIINAIKWRNYRLTEVNIYSNYGQVENHDEAVEEFKEALLLLRQSLNRNIHLTRETEQQALRLLRYSRPILLNSGLNADVKPSQNDTPCEPSYSRFLAPDVTSLLSAAQSQSDPPFPKLPTEIKHHILSYFAPILSATQRIRIYHYASLSSTLPQLLPLSLPRLSSPIHGNSLWNPNPTSRGLANSGKGSIEDGCTGGICTGGHNSVACLREQDRNAWLAAIGCDAYDPDQRTV